MKRIVSGKTAIAAVTAWFILGLGFVFYTLLSQRVALENELQQATVILHRLVSQRSDQHDAHLTSLAALAQASDPPPADLFLQVAAAIQRFYPRVLAVDLVPLVSDTEPY